MALLIQDAIEPSDFFRHIPPWEFLGSEGSQILCASIWDHSKASIIFSRRNRADFFCRVLVLEGNWPLLYQPV